MTDDLKPFAFETNDGELGSIVWAKNLHEARKMASEELCVRMVDLNYIRNED